MARVALVVLAFAALFAFGDAVRASSASTDQRSSAVVARVVDARAVAAIPARSADWATTQQRGPQGNDQLVAVLLAGALLVVTSAWRRASSAASRSRCALSAQRAASRAPPAFV
jgi:hypothetical protein